MMCGVQERTRGEPVSHALRRILAATVAGMATFAPGATAKWGVYVCVLLLVLNRPHRFTRCEVAAVALLAWAWASTSWAEFPAVSDGALHALVRLTVVFLGIRHAITSRRDLRTVAIGYLAGCLTAVVLAMTSDQAEAQRLTIAGVNQNYLAYTLAAGAAVSLLWWDMSARTVRTKVTLLVYGAVMMAGVFLTGTRGALLGIALVLLWVLVHRVAARGALRGLILAVAGVGYLIASGAVDNILLHLEWGIRSDRTLGGRLIMWPIARTLWGESFWRGIGVGGFRGSPIGIPAHNLILEAGVGMGVVGVALFLLVLWLALGSETKGVAWQRRSLLVGSFVAAAAPAYLSGAFEYIAPSWMVLAIFSRVSLLAPDQSEIESQQVDAQAVGALNAR
jgi:O-antigen ligase